MNYCKICFKEINPDGTGHQEWCPHYHPPIDFDTLFPGINKKVK